MEVFKGVIRYHGAMEVAKPKGKKKDKLHRYSVIGMIVTDEPIESLNVNQELLAGECSILQSLTLIPKVKPKRKIIGCTADEILISLNQI